MSRVVVAGPYPIMPGPEAAATFALVRRLVAEGHDVTVISPQPSAAHHFADPGSPRGAARLTMLLRDVEILHLRLDAAALDAGQESRALMAGRLALRVALQRAGRRVVRLDRVPPSVSRQFAIVVLSKADEVVVATEGEQQALVDAGVPVARIVVDPEPEIGRGATRPGERLDVASLAPRPLSLTSADEVQDLVRRRAAGARAARRAAAVTDLGTASSSLRQLPQMERPLTRSNKVGGVFLKRVMAKATQWQYDNVIVAVNRLHQATTRAVETLEAELAEPARPEPRPDGPAR